MGERKPLATIEEQDAAYPQHARLRALKEQELGAERMLRYLSRTRFIGWLFELEAVGALLDGVRPLVEDQDPPRPGEDTVTETELDGGSAVVSQLCQSLRQLDPGHGDARRVILECLEIDGDAFWREKDDMLEQLRLHQLPPTAVPMAQAEEERREAAWCQTLRAALERVFEGHPEEYPGEVQVTEQVEAVGVQETELDEHEQLVAITFEVQLSVRQSHPTGFSQEDHYPTLRVPAAGGELQLAGIDLYRELRPT